MRIKQPHIPYISNKIALDLVNSKFLKAVNGIEPIKALVTELISALVKKEKQLDEKVNDIINEQETEIDLMQIDRKNMFWLLKKKLADEYGILMNYEDRYNALSHDILDKLIDEDLINFSVSENKVRNVIFASLNSYLKSYEKIEDDVYEKISNYKRKLVPGSEEFDLVYEKLYEEELKRRGML
ncbi:DUF507 family protein [Campylobacter canadensis]|uniref:DUF507 family protein n=1 Tax=Campylobacter canadensis TaxID=449520 RepID=A0ABS7WW44_9BACT|nr:DUF507 family protein [Campylobacter canadensis]MBZ7988134.1 DUF507 family protein [Campylobacter canadensis]MBZ7995554.1 DUF507 family protein [Campylobacter canadensis]MBZ7997368.1 DUF507 family protein [Campylobacter canadensis]MBZ7999117.1 DUF507 family protein [Campylobacter canadensis]MBZ8000928.1 DUF507 family protein [Campylobacter canadensis]